MITRISIKRRLPITKRKEKKRVEIELEIELDVTSATSKQDSLMPKSSSARSYLTMLGVKKNRNNSP